MQIFNQYSYPVFMVIFGLMLLAGLSRIPQFTPVMLLVVMGIYGLVAIFIGTRFQYPDSPVEVETVAEVEATLINEKPTFLMLYSNY